jgi:hypothetical protein
MHVDGLRMTASEFGRFTRRARQRRTHNLFIMCRARAADQEAALHIRKRGK